MYDTLAPDTEETNFAFKSFFENEDGYSVLFANYDLIYETISFCKPPSNETPYTQLYFEVYADCYEDYFDLEIVDVNADFFNGELPTLRFEKMTKEAFREIYGEERFSRITVE